MQTIEPAVTGVANAAAFAAALPRLNANTPNEPPPPFKTVQDAVSLTREAKDGLALAEQLDSSADAVRQSMDQLTEMLDAAAKDVAWLLKSLGMPEEFLPDAQAKVGEAFREKAREQTGGFAVVVEQSVSVRMEMREISLTVSQGNKVTEVSLTSFSLSATSSTTITAAMWGSGLAGSASQGGGVGGGGNSAPPVDPLVLDLTGNGIDLTPPERGPRIDLDGDGKIEQTAWVQGDDALLAMDRDGDGKITSGHELFGQANGGADGFAELAALDDNKDGVIDAQDSGFSSLLLLREGGRLDSLATEGITRIRLDLIHPVSQSAGLGGSLSALSLFERDNGTYGQIADALFDVRV